MKKLLIAFGFMALAIVLGLSVYQFKVRANPSRFEHTYTATATSTLVSATTTLTFITSGADRADVNLIFRASSSAASLKWTYEYSNNGVDWYGEDSMGSVSGSSVTHATSTITHFWTPGNWTAVGTTSSSSMKSILDIPVSNNNYMRINFNPVGVNGLLWADAIVKVQESN